MNLSYFNIIFINIRLLLFVYQSAFNQLIDSRLMESIFNHTLLELIVFTSSGICTFTTTILTFYLIHMHLKYYTDPQAQTYIIRIIVMPIIYSVHSTLSIIYYKYSIYFCIVRDCYD